MLKVQRKEILERLKRLAENTQRVRNEFSTARLKNDAQVAIACGHCGPGSQD